MSHHEESAVSHTAAHKRVHRCPKCKNGTLEDRIPRGFVVKYLLGVLPLRRYICYRCFKKSYVWHREGDWSRIAESLPNIAPPDRFCAWMIWILFFICYYFKEMFFEIPGTIFYIFCYQKIDTINIKCWIGIVFVWVGIAVSYEMIVEAFALNM